MATKAKRRIHPMPKLGWKDHLLYWAGITITFSSMLFCLFFPIHYRSKLAHSDLRVFIFSDGEGAFHFWWLLLVSGIFFIIVVKLYSARIPVFGRRDISYGPPAYPRVYPVLMKNKPRHWKSPKAAAAKKRKITVAAILLAIALILSVMVFPCSLYGRCELYHDGSVAIYDSANHVRTYSVEDMESVRLEAIPSRRYWSVGFVFTFSDGSTCEISIPKTSGDWTGNLLKAQHLKQFYGSILTVDADDLWRVVLSQKVDAAEKELLYDLFDAN